MTVSPELESEPIVDDDVVLVGPPRFGGRRLRARELEGLTWISREEGSATREAVEAARWEIVERSREHYSRAGDVLGVGGATHSLGDVSLDEGDHGAALALYREALEIEEPVANPRDGAYTLAGIASSSAALGRGAAAARLWGGVERLDGDLDHGITDYHRRVYERVLGKLDPDELAAGRALSDDEALTLGRQLSRASGS